MGARRAACEQSLHQVFDVVGQAGDETTDARRRFEHHFGQHHHHVLAGERRFSGQTLEHDATEREDVDAGVDLPLPQRLFWRHITRSSDDCACARRSRRRQVGDPEVDELQALDLAVDQEEIARLDVAMDHPLVVRGAQLMPRIERPGGFRDGEWCVRPFLQRLPLEGHHHGTSCRLLPNHARRSSRSRGTSKALQRALFFSNRRARSCDNRRGGHPPAALQIPRACTAPIAPWPA